MPWWSSWLGKTAAGGLSPHATQCATAFGRRLLKVFSNDDAELPVPEVREAFAEVRADVRDTAEAWRRVVLCWRCQRAVEERLGPEFRKKLVTEFASLVENAGQLMGMGKGQGAGVLSCFNQLDRAAALDLRTAAGEPLPFELAAAIVGLRDTPTSPFFRQEIFDDQEWLVGAGLEELSAEDEALAARFAEEAWLAMGGQEGVPS